MHYYESRFNVIHCFSYNIHNKEILNSVRSLIQPYLFFHTLLWLRVIKYEIQDFNGVNFYQSKFIILAIQKNLGRFKEYYITKVIGSNLKKYWKC